MLNLPKLHQNPKVLRFALLYSMYFLTNRLANYQMCPFNLTTVRRLSAISVITMLIPK